MSQTVKASYRGGAFIPQTPCDLPENSEVELIIEGGYIVPPKVTDPQEREQILKRIVERMKQNPLPANSPRFTREELHERG